MVSKLIQVWRAITDEGHNSNSPSRIGYYRHRPRLTAEDAVSWREMFGIKQHRLKIPTTTTARRRSRRRPATVGRQKSCYFKLLSEDKRCRADLQLYANFR